MLIKQFHSFFSICTCVIINTQPTCRVDPAENQLYGKNMCRANPFAGSTRLAPSGSTRLHIIVHKADPPTKKNIIFFSYNRLKNLSRQVSQPACRVSSLPYNQPLMLHKEINRTWLCKCFYCTNPWISLPMCCCL